MPTASKDAAGWLVNYTIAGTGEKTISFKTENKFIDADARVVISTPAASNPTLDLADNSTTLTMGTASNGIYSPTATLTGNASIASAGWIAADDYSVSDANVVVGKVNQSTILNGQSPVASGSTIVPGPSDQTITISEGYNTARTLTIGSASASSPGAVTSGSVTFTEADTLSITHTDGNNYFEVTGTKDVSAPTVDTAGYVSGSIGTLNANTNGAVLDVKMPIGEIRYNIESNRLVQPEIEKQAISIVGVTDAANGAATSTTPNSGVYVAVQAPNVTKNITITADVGTEGYIRDGIIQYANSGTFPVGTVDSQVFYVPIRTTSAQVDGRNVTYGSGWITAGTTSIPAGTVTSGSATITSLSATFTQDEEWLFGGHADVSAPIIDTAGYVSGTVGTLNTNTNGAQVRCTIPQIKLDVGVTGATSALKPTLAKQVIDISNVVDASNGDASSTAPTAGAYVAIRSNANTGTITASPSVYSAGYGTLEHYERYRRKTVTVGAEQSDIYYVPIKAGAVTSGSATITSTSIAYNSSTGKYSITGSADVSAPTFTEGYIASNVGTKNSNSDGAQLSSTLDKIAIQANLSGTGTKTPSITKNNNTNIAEAGAATTTQPASGYYVAVSSAANTGTVAATAIVTSAGYGTTTSGQYTTTPSSNLTVGAAASAVTYIPISGATFANAATSGTTYTDISNSAPVLVSGDYLYINAGYVENSKISLAQLVPDGASASLTGDYILSGYSAYDDNGALVAGTIGTYGGNYTIV